eukprot:CAMPEP_0170495080 /NCGR_PEP_ID=MMETSP0208-20121228/15005_1 /TAXON_ID=197538 /ORGANISM="Strombidium inclinatum, Strain S3" /LENGTH=76 /DNA_ID=CAMNT_0010771219 /DNA_START=366 /DNA_END=596 /DNA_ORIENTATION=+
MADPLKKLEVVKFENDFPSLAKSDKYKLRELGLNGNVEVEINEDYREEALKVFPETEIEGYSRSIFMAQHIKDKLQ